MDAPLPSYQELFDDIHRIRERIRLRAGRLSPTALARWQELERRAVSAEWKGRPRDVSAGEAAHSLAFELRLALQEFLSIHFPETQKQFADWVPETREAEAGTGVAAP